MKDRLLAHLKLTFYVCLLTAVMVGLYLKDAPAAVNFLPAIYQLSIPAYYGMLLIIAALLLLPFGLSRATRWLWPLVVWVWLVYLAIDVAVFNLYRFHLEWLMVDMFVRDFSGMGIPVFLLILFAGLSLALLGFVLWLYSAKLSGTRRHWPWFVVGLCLMPVGFFVNSVINIWAIHYNRNEIMAYRPYLPVYYPIELDARAEAISASWPAVFPAARGTSDKLDSKAAGIVTYPLAQPQCQPAAQAPNILMIVLESWQADAMNAKVTPNMARYAESSTRFNQHISSGAATVPGLFGLMYGLHPNYFNLLRSSSNSYPSVFTETLHQQGYRERVFTSSNLDGFSLRSLFFPRVTQEDFVDHLPDQVLVDRYIASLQASPKEQPRFDFLFLTSSHASYNYPAEYAHFMPLPAVEGGYALDRQADVKPYKNDYYNSLFYLDSLIAKLLAAAEKQGKLKNTWVVITGDHAEEFNENGLGYWGHGSNFTRWQTQTPLIVHAPGQHAGKVESKLSLHQDVVPTLMKEALGCSSPATDYSHGANLFSLPEKRNTVMASYMSNAYLVNGTVIDKSVNKKYDWSDMQKTYAPVDMNAVREMMSEERRFISAAP